VLLSDVASGTAAMSASSAFNDRRWKAGTAIERSPYSIGQAFNRNANVRDRISQDLNSTKTCNRIQGGSTIA
jgi:hypothetical protein